MQKSDLTDLRPQTGAILKLVVGHGMKLVASSIVLGLAASSSLTRLIAKMLFGVSAVDPPTFIVITLLLTFAALLACWIPARRATKIDPMTALRFAVRPIPSPSATTERAQRQLPPPYFDDVTLRQMTLFDCYEGETRLALQE